MSLRILIHAPLAGCDSARSTARQKPVNFNPRTPCGVRRSRQWSLVTYAGISIHAPLAGCDAQRSGIDRQENHFNPRTPCGVRPKTRSGRRTRCTFQSTHPLRGATRQTRSHATSMRFQSTHPLRGATRPRRYTAGAISHFNPRTPCGVRPQNIIITI